VGWPWGFAVARLWLIERNTSCEDKRPFVHKYEEFGAPKGLDFLQAFRQTADDLLYLPSTSFGVEADGLRVLHFVTDGEDTKG
jgi:hypothetical protein